MVNNYSFLFHKIIKYGILINKTIKRNVKFMTNRLCLATMEKDTAADLRNMSYQEFVHIYLEGKRNNYLGINDLPFSRDVYMFERYVDVEITELLVNESNSSFFNDSELVNYYYSEDQSVYEIGKEGLLKLIEYYRSKVIDAYRYSLGYPTEETDYINGEKTVLEKQTEFMENRLDVWTNDKKDPINLEKTGNGLTNIYLYEYTIFTFIHLLKTIDFENQTLMMYSF